MTYLDRAIKDGYAIITGPENKQKIIYVTSDNHTENYNDPEEKVRAEFWAELIYEYDYPAHRIKVEVTIPDRVPTDRADIVIFSDDECKKPYAVVECKRDGVTDAEFLQAIEQGVGNATWVKLRASYVVIIAGATRRVLDFSDDSTGILERENNIIADLPKAYGKPQAFRFYRGGEYTDADGKKKKAPDIQPVAREDLITAIKKCHNTLWGGVIGDDGVDGIEIGHETATAEAFYAFQKYVKEQQKIGVLLGVCSKNDYENAVTGLNHPDGVLKPDDFISIKANWEPKDSNIAVMAEEIGILPESIVFADDNPAEREIVSGQLNVQSPSLENPENYIKIIDRSGFFEVTSFSDDDINRNAMYKANAQRVKVSKKFENYDDYLLSLEMTAEIEEFKSIDLQRITQLTNKSNQFNLTTKRYTQNEIEKISSDGNYITLCGRLKDKFGDNGIVSVVIGRKENDALHIDLWLMSCRVLKRNMEYAMLDCLVSEAKLEGIRKIYGYYLKTKKNSMVKSLFSDFGFEKISEDIEENTVWEMDIKNYIPKNKLITVKQTQKV